MERTFIIAIDGQAASGKTSLTKNLAEKLGYNYLLTGNIYRALAKKVIETNTVLSDHLAIIKLALSMQFDDLSSSDLGSDEIALTASKIATIESVRLALIDIQRTFAQMGYRGIIVEGRDIATVIFPEADVKLFIFASPQVRATRRFKELQNQGIEVIYERVLEDLIERDKRDSTRATSPLKASEDATLIDTSDMIPAEVVNVALSVINTKLKP